MIMKRIVSIICGTMLMTGLVSCGSATPEKDKNGDTPKMVVERMYQSIQQNDFATAVACCNVPDTVVIKNMKDANGNVRFDTIPNNVERVTKAMLDQTMQSSYRVIKSWDVEEEGDRTDPNLAKVKATVVFESKDGKTETVETSFPMKRGRDNVWKING